MNAIAEKIIDHCSEDLEEAGFELEDIAEVERVFAYLVEKEKREFLAIPAELRVPLFTRYAERIRKGEIDAGGGWCRKY